MGGGEVAVSFLDTCNKTRGALSVEPWQYYYITAFLLAWKHIKTRSSWFNCALLDDEAVYWVIIGQYEAVAVGY